MTEKLRKTAMQSDGRRKCAGCPFYLVSCKFGHCNSEAAFKICTEAFVDGFRKGSAWQKKQSKNKKQ